MKNLIITFSFLTSLNLLANTAIFELTQTNLFKNKVINNIEKVVNTDE